MEKQLEQEINKLNMLAVNHYLMGRYDKMRKCLNELEKKLKEANKK